MAAERRYCTDVGLLNLVLRIEWAAPCADDTLGYACFNSRSRRENRLLRRAAVFLCKVLVHEILSRRPQYLLNSVSAKEMSFAASASRNDLDWSFIRRFRQWFTARRFAFCLTSFLADRDCGTVNLQCISFAQTVGRTWNYPKNQQEVKPLGGLWRSDIGLTLVFYPFLVEIEP